MRLTRIKKCAVCNFTEFLFLFKKNGFALNKCRNCSFVFVNPRPEEKALLSYYNEDFFKGRMKFPGRWTKNYCEGTAAYTGRSKKALAKIAQYKNGGKLLDVGCGLGYLIEEARNNGWEVMGLEISDYAIRQCKKKNLNVKRGQIEKLGGFSSFFDVIVAQDVLEHVFKPEEFLGKVNNLLKINGLLVLELPNNSSLKTNLLGKEWGEYIPPVHLNFFDKNNLSQILEKHGFEIKKIYSEISITIGLREVLRRLVRDKSGLIYSFLKVSDLSITNFKRQFFYPPLNFIAQKFDIHGDLLIAFATKNSKQL